MTDEPAQRWLRTYATLALQVNRQVVGTSRGTVLICRGPQEWRAQVEADDPPPPARLAEDTERLLAEIPFDPPRATFLASQVGASPHRRPGAIAGR
ncbi:hypothetical protein K8Z49_26090 [Actinomadura madurae]|uniref:hypothetical protein n=1 Tax=Actinomadura madurae TaxID=1993 RepID=UPI003999984E